MRCCAMTAQAEFAAPIAPVPADLPNLQRRHNTRLSLADGPIQTFIANQLAILDVMIYTAVAEDASSRDRAVEIMREHAASRAQVQDARQQSLNVELATLDLWRLRLGFDPKRQGVDEEAAMEDQQDGGAP